MDLVSLFLICLKVSLLSFGGSAPLPLLQDELGRQRGLLRDEDFASAIAIGRITPGPNGLFVLPVGYFVAGIPGALVAAAARFGGTGVGRGPPAGARKAERARVLLGGLK